MKFRMMQLFCLQLETSCLQLSFSAYNCVFGVFCLQLELLCLQLVSVALPAEPRGEKKLFFVQILGGEKLLKFGEKWAVKNF